VSQLQFILDKGKCIGADACGGVCARICPPDIIEYVDEKGKKYPVLSDIEMCMKDHGCQNNCPVHAIIILPPQEEGR
jgi:NAD-dependent dihydropyrimidine dehydrogenase PreA subunit